MAIQAAIEPILERLAYLRRRIRILFLVNAISRIAIFLAIFFVLTFLADWLFVLPKELRLAIFAGGVAWLGYLIIRHVIYPLSMKISDDELALAVERIYPLGDGLISS